MTKLMDGKLLANNICQKVKKDIETLKLKDIIPTLSVILVGEDSASKIYVELKRKKCEELGMQSQIHILPVETTQQELINLIKSQNGDRNVSGILLQHPIPSHLNEYEAIDAISPLKDVDGFHPVNAGNLSIGRDSFIPCTPYGILTLLKEYNVELEGKHCVVVGRSNIVGKPMAQLMLNQNCTVTITHSKTKNLKQITRTADILIVAIGKAKFITAEMVSPGAVVIDVGMNRDSESRKLYGDVDFEEVIKICSYITPVPGGVGPMTIAMLMKNTIKAAEMQNSEVAK